jgi:hypothetical protein
MQLLSSGRARKGEASDRLTGQVPPIRVRVTDNDNRPLKGKWVFANTWLMAGIHIFENQVRHVCLYLFFEPSQAAMRL